MINGYRFLYLRDKNRFPVACVAMDYDKVKNNVRVGLSTVHPLDKKGSFSKAVARRLAVGAAILTPISVPMKVVSSLITTHDITSEVLGTLEHNHTVPTRVRKAIDLWFKTTDALPPEDAPPVSVEASLPKITAGVRHISASKRNSLISYTADIVPTIPKHDTWPLPPITMGGF